jgi:pyruvate dehydrogenase E2 component (dihydrolipoamide acetyltransferase)
MPAACAKCGHEHDDWVPASRLSEVAQQRKAAEEEAKAAKAEAAQAKAAQEEATGKLAKLGEVEAALATTTAERERLALQAQVYEAGLTDKEGVGLALTMWAALPADARPSEGVGAWLTSDAAPRGVRVYMAQAAAAAPAATEAPAAAAPAAAPAPTGQQASKTVVASQGLATGALTAQRIASMTPAEYRAAQARGEIAATMQAVLGRQS